jgi:hypothetical protein
MLQLGVVVHTYNLSTGRQKWEDCELKASLGYTVRPCFKKSELELETSLEPQKYLGHDTFIFQLIKSLRFRWVSDLRKVTQEISHLWGFPHLVDLFSLTFLSPGLALHLAALRNPRVPS